MAVWGKLTPMEDVARLTMLLMFLDIIGMGVVLKGED